MLSVTIGRRSLRRIASGFVWRNVDSYCVVGAGVYRIRYSLLGSIILVLTLADQSFYTLVGAIMNVIQGDGPRAVLIPVFNSTTAITGLLAALNTILRRKDLTIGQRFVPRVAQGTTLRFALLLGASVLTAQSAPIVHRDIALHTANMVYSQPELAVDCGEITLALANDDLFWHTSP